MGGPDRENGQKQIIYNPLVGPHDIRLVELLPASKQEDQIYCRMVSSFLAEPPSSCPISYEALSYTWDSPSLIVQIDCDGHQLSVTPNLHGALRSLRAMDKSRILWVDQISINQKDLAERSAQVRIMHRVYQQAAQVIVWLGEADATSSVAIEFLVSLNETFADWKLRRPGRAITFADLGKYGLPKKADLRWRYLGALLARPWFFRLWILQEVVFASSVSVLCGEAQVSWITFISFVLRLCAYPLLEQHFTNFWGPFPHGMFTITRIVYIQNRMPTIPISDLLFLTNRQLATDMHDKFYAIMGFLSEETRLIPDYSLSIEELFVEIARKALHVGDISILRYAGSLPSKRNLPSWVPDWSVDFNDIPEPIMRADHNFTAGGDSQADLTWPDNKNLLGVQATFIDRLDEGSDTLIPFPLLENPWYGPLDRKDEWAREMGIFIGSAFKLAARCLPALDAAAYQERLWRTLVMESNANSLPVDKSFGKYFNIFFQDLKWYYIFAHQPLRWLLNPFLLAEGLSMVVRRRHHQDGVTTFLAALTPAGAGRRLC